VNHIPPHHQLVDFYDGPLAGRTRPIYEGILANDGWHHGVPSKNETGNGGVIWSYGHRWPTGCPRYVLTRGEPNTARWRPITDEEFRAGEHAEAAWRSWVKVLHPFPFAGDVALYAREAAERKGITDKKVLLLVASQAVAATRLREGASITFVFCDTIPEHYDYVCDVRGNLQVRLRPGRARWFQPGPDVYSDHPTHYQWIPRVRNTSELLAKGPLTVVPADRINAAHAVRLDGLRQAAERFLSRDNALVDA
jgi:hypothetical protein